jgi:hypothetical protein
MDRTSAFDKVQAHLSNSSGLVAELAARLVEHLRRLTAEIDELKGEITSRTAVLAPSLLAIPGCGPLIAAKSVRPLVSIDFTPKMRSHGTTGPRRFRYGRRTALDIDSRAPETVSSMPQSTASHSLRPAVIPTLEHCWHVARPAATVEWKHSASSNADCRTSSSKR